MNGMFIAHEPVRLAPGPGRTKQSFSEESNINIIMRKYEKTGMIDHLNTHQGDYRNFIEAPDYHTSMNLIREAGEAFMTIPAGIRAKFANDPAQFLAFVQNPDNHDQMVEMGFAKARPLAEKAPPEPEKPSGPPKEPNGDDGGRTAVDPPA